ncbi:MAG: tol-pal system-associated acyl-CoA thioesterase [Gallionellales bacterium CG_4_10_14_3_um_filter_54_96]|nr:MAG: tol-pal system-associated acyl-CoA thioesterase [Gallionellaceae bacterium CG1_02_56_997]PIV15644.1 MAG: tol-pal system-associated acyl-CoA thioesterase [Gallionellales bacterium CG03_land_8_20_14_0_80_55_15]PIX04197.1 MAG: tol-pal system-associated acyl-CoA thioesterase [Gallionellales bacterium CG_4_8_14_3_um_filter_54_18]PIY05323.1 MAG: tol-pal system-associated acyl-CoA thioesterase [Gallionellales bacterium CG_4_10_14_3_um_filter_54_96]PJC03083.1 MAG: tol-pal system-associated acyl
MTRHKIFSWPVRVYFQDTDAGGVVYHASYVNFFERARTEWLRTFGYSNAGLMKAFGIVFVVRSMKLDYLRPALLDDMLDVTAEVKDIGRSRLTLLQTVRRGDELLTEAEVHLVCVSLEGFKPVSVPEVLKSQWK